MKIRDIKLHLAIIRFRWLDTIDKKKLFSKYNISSKKDEDFDDKMVRWFEDEFYPMEPEEKEIIPYDEWAIDDLIGTTEKALYHEHYNIWWDHVYNNHQPKHKICLVFECSNKKPYFDNKALRYYIYRYHDYCDFASIDYGIMPWEYVNLYPVRYDEWDHSAESDHIAYLYSELTKKRILEYRSHFPDQHLVFICQNNHPQRPVNELYESNTDNFREWATIITDEKFREDMITQYPHLNPQLRTLRTLPSKLLQSRIKSAVERILGEEIVFPKKIRPYNPYRTLDIIN